MKQDMITWVRDLEEEVISLRRQMRELTGVESDDKWHMLNLTRSEERILRVLLLRDLATHEAIATALYWDKHECYGDETIKVFMSNIRRKLPFLKPWITCKWGLGYVLHPEGKHRLMFELRNPGVASKPA